MSNRKLLSEVERTLKKVDEGIELFDEFESKLNAASTASQKERWEGEMKKEIKRLQRLRDQIKTWQTSSEIKEKEPLTESRKKIESLMEKFKSLEKDLKIKAYSKEGLIAASRLDPREKEKVEATHWLNTIVEKMQTQVDLFEAELETSLLSLKKTASSKKSAPEKTPRQKRLQEWVDRHKRYIRQIELLLRKIENEDVLPDDISQLKEYIEDFLDSFEKDDYIEDDTIFDVFDLDSELKVPAKDDSTDKPRETVDKPKDPREKGRNSTSPEKPSASLEKPAVAIIVNSDKPATNITSYHGFVNSTTSASHAPTSQLNDSELSNTRKSPPLKSKNGKASFGDAELAENNRGWVKPPSITSHVLKKTTEISSQGNGPAETTKSIELYKDGKSEDALPVKTKRPSFSSAMDSPLMAKVEAQFESAHARSFSSCFPHSGQCRASPFEDLENMARSVHGPSPTFSNFKSQLVPFDVTPVVSVVPSSQFPLPLHLPNHFEKPSFYEKLPLDTLFAIFYYFPGTSFQYWAARELKRQSWRFHKKYLTWFQRHEEPKIITEDYEQGTYIYFDYEGAWCQRKKSDFTFEYRFLEDTELV